MRGRRNKLLWIGGDPGIACASACAGRQLDLEVVAQELTATHLIQGRGLIVAIDEGAAGSLLDNSIRQLLCQAISHGLKTFISCTFSDAPAAASALANWRLNRSIEVCLRGEESASIETVARVKHEPSVNDTLSSEGAGDLAPEEMILLKRAFADCSSVRLVRQSTGSAKVFCAFASLLHSRVGPVPLPFFVKFNDAHKILRELENYRECTTLHIPFNQRPNLDPERCMVGHTTGIIVGNFVEQSESLQEVIDRRAGRGALHSLFDGALRGWRRQAFYDDARYVGEGNILERLSLARPSAFSQRRKMKLRERREHNGPDVAEFEELEAMLAAMPPMRYRFGITHGDLHGQNVRVAGNDAILIDFASIADGPLTVDPAALDVSLVIDTELAQGSEWTRMADQLFSLEALRAPAIPPRPEHPCANLLDALQYIRQVAFGVQSTDIEYPVVVAVQLLRKSSYPGSDKEQERRRRHAYRLADGIIKDIAGPIFLATKKVRADIRLARPIARASRQGRSATLSSSNHSARLSEAIKTALGILAAAPP